MTTPRSLQLPQASDPCLCGSGLTFRNCCRARLPGKGIGKLWKEAAHNQQWLRALKALRADITQYTIWHSNHTVPLMRRFPPESIEILTIDIEALNDEVDDLLHIYLRMGRLSGFPAVLERLRSNIDDPRWHRKIIYQRAITAHLLDDTAGARRELAKLGEIGPEEADLETLQLHIDLNGERLSMLEKLQLYDRILAITDSRQDRMQYSAAKAIELVVAEDRAGAASVAVPALAAAIASEAERPYEPPTELWLCKLIEVTAIATKNIGLLANAAERLQRLATLPEGWTAQGRAFVYRCLGDVQRGRVAWAEAEASYASGYALDHDPMSLVFQATCLLMLDRQVDALTLIQKIAFSELDAAEQVDYALAYAAIAIALRDATEVQVAARLVEATRPLRPYFQREKLRYQLEIERARAAIEAGEEVPKSSRLLDWITSINRWLMVQPNVAGFGVNLNLVVEDILSAHRKRKPRAKDGQTGEE